MFPQALDVMPPTDQIWWTLLRYYLFLGFAAGTIVTVLMFYWIHKYHHTNVKEAPQFHEETGWGNWKTVVLTLLVTGSVLAFVETETFLSTGLYNPPANADPPLNISVTGQQFVWIFHYPDGYTTFSSTKSLIVPVDTIVILNITSSDVDHSLFIPSLSVAKDAIPGQYNYVWFNATQTGVWVDGIRCKELCGVGHATMIGNFTVLSQAAFAAWYATTMPASTTTTAASNSSSTSGTGATASIILPSGVGNDQSLNFQPSTLTVAAGTTITFVDQDNSAIHDVDFMTGPSGATLPSTSSNLKDGDTFTVTLTTPGTYTYVCDYHTWMKGSITVTG
jgi:cytochrome c oxidase subunit II